MLAEISLERENADPHEPRFCISSVSGSVSMLIPTMVLAGANIYFGIDTNLPIGVSEAAANGMLTGSW